MKFTNTIHIKILLLVVGFLCNSIIVFAQDELEPLEDQLEESYGIDKLAILNELTEHYFELNIRKSIKYGKQAVDISENLFDEADSSAGTRDYFLKVDAYNLLGEAHYIKENYFDAQKSFKSALNYALKIDYAKGTNSAENYLTKLDSIGVKSNIFKETLSDLKLSRTINAGSQDLALSTTLKSAETNENNGNFEKAIKNYEKAINYLRDKGDDEQIAELYRRIAENYDKLGNISKSLEYYKLAIGEKEKLGDTTGLQASKEGINNLHEQIDELVKPVESKEDSVEKVVQLKTLEDYKKMAVESEANEDYETSLEYYKLYNELSDKIIEDEKEQELALLDKSHQIERNLQEIQLLTQDKEIQELELLKQESEIEQQNKFRKNLIIGLILLLALAGALYLLYTNKRRDHTRLNVAHQDLKSTQEKLIYAEKKIKTLLDQQVSTSVARELLSESSEDNIQSKKVCVMFLDIRGFTPFAESRKPEEIIQYQNEVFGFMIDSVYKNHGIINQFLGDGFMATFGAPVSTGNDTENAFQAAKEIIRTVNEKSKNGSIPSTRIGIGLHTGRVVAGNVGTDLRKQYSVTGNAVIIAARIEQLNKEYNSQLLISKEVYQELEPENRLKEEYIKVLVKGRKEPLQILKIV